MHDGMSGRPRAGGSAVRERIAALPAIAPALPVTVLLLIAALLRLRQYVFNRSFWYDEALVAGQVVQHSFGDLLGSISGAPVGFLLPAKLATVVLGNTDWALRGVPMLAGLATLVFASRFVRPVFHSLPARACFAGLVGFASPLIYYSSELKPYAADVAVTLAMWSLAASFHADRARRDATTLALAGSLCIWLSWSSVFVLAAVGLVLWGEMALRRSWQAVAALSAAGAAWAASFAVSYWLTLRPLTDNTWLENYWAAGYAPSPFANPYWYRDSAFGLVYTAFGPSGPIPMEARLAWYTHPILALTILALLGLGVLARLAPRTAAIVVLTVAATIVASAFQVYPFRSRLILFLVPVVYVALAAIVERLAHRTHGSLRAAAMLLTAGLLSWQLSNSLPVAWKPSNNADIKSALARVEANRQPGDRIAVSAWSRPAYEFYAGKYGLADLPVATTIPASDSAFEFMNAVDGRRDIGRLWIVFSHRFAERVRFFDDIAPLAAPTLFAWEGDGAGAWLLDLSPGSRTGPGTVPE